MSTTLPRRSAEEMSCPRKSFTENSGRLEPTSPGAMAFSCGVAGLHGLAHANSPTKAKFTKPKQRLRIYPFLCISRINSFNGAEVSGFVFFLPKSEEHTSELQSQSNLVCRLLLEKKNNKL